MRIAVPANVAMVWEVIIPIATFDVLDPDWTYKLVMDFDEDHWVENQNELFDQWRDLTYDTKNVILILGSLSIFLILLLFFFR